MHWVKSHVKTGESTLSSKFCLLFLTYMFSKLQFIFTVFVQDEIIFDMMFSNWSSVLLY